MVFVNFLALCAFSLTAFQVSAQSCATNSTPWTLLFAHDRAGGSFGMDELDVNTDVVDISDQLQLLRYSNLRQLQDSDATFRSADGFFYFRLKWPKLCDDPFYECNNGLNYISWRQSSNPMTEMIAGYQFLDGDFGSSFQGLIPGTFAFMDAQQGFNFWFSVGSFNLFNDLIPGPIPSGRLQGVATTRVELSVKVYSDPGDVFEAGFGTACTAEHAECAGAGVCTCPSPFFTGDGDVECVDVLECTNATDCDPNAYCADHLYGYTCACKPGYFGNGTFCEVDECATSTDNCHPTLAQCSKQAGNFTCTCLDGYQGDGVTCVDIDECTAATDNCHPNATCTNTIGGFNCTCDVGLDGNGVICEDATIAWYDETSIVLNGTWQDLSINQNDAVLGLNVTYDNINKRFFFRKNATIDELVSIPLAIGPSAYPQLTIEVLFQPIEAESYGWFIDTEDGGYDRGMGFSDARYLGLDRTTPTAMASGTGSPFNSGLDAPWPRCWHLAFAVYDQGTLGGSFMAMNRFVGYPTTSFNTEGKNDIFVGGSERNGGMTGYVKRVKVYDTALSTDEIWKKYNAARDDLTCECLPGYEGDEFTGCIDIDECARDTHDCNRLDDRATCTNTIGSFTCTCLSPFVGDGRICEPVSDCAVSDWEDASECSASCGTGTKLQTRSVVRAAGVGGAACPVLSRTAACTNLVQCASGTTYDVVVSAPTSSLDTSFHQLSSMTALSSSVPLVTLSTFAQTSSSTTEIEYGVTSTLSLSALRSSVSSALSAGESIVRVTARTSCWCPGEMDEDDQGWQGTECNSLSPSQPTCSGGIRTRQCGITGLWQDVNSEACENDVFQTLLDGLTAANIRQTLTSLALASSSPLSLSSVDIQRIVKIINAIIAFYDAGEAQLKNEDVSLILKVTSNIISASGPSLDAGLYLQRGSSLYLEELEDFLVNYTSTDLALDTSLSVIEPRLAVDLVNSRGLDDFPRVWPYRNSSVASSRMCTGTGLSQTCSFVDHGVSVTKFDADTTITVPVTALNKSLEVGGSSRVVFGVFAVNSIFPRSGLIAPISQIVFATVADLPEKYNLTFDPLLYTATPDFRNRTRCAYWEPGLWSTEGCVAVSGAEKTDTGAVSCSCSHLTHFGVVEESEPQPSRPLPTVEESMRASAFTSGCFCIIILLYLALRREHWSPSRTVYLIQSLCMSMFLLMFGFLVYEVEDESCSKHGIALFFFLFSAACWNTSGGLLSMFDDKLPTFVLWLVGYVPSIVLAAVSSQLYVDDFGRSRDFNDLHRHCFIDPISPAFWLAAGPFIGVLCVALVLYMWTCVRSCCWPKQDGTTRTHAVSVTIAHIVLTLLLCLIAATAVLGVNGDDSAVYPVLFAGFSSGWVAIVLLIFIFGELFHCHRSAVVDVESGGEPHAGTLRVIKPFAAARADPSSSSTERKPKKEKKPKAKKEKKVKTKKQPPGLEMVSLDTIPTVGEHLLEDETAVDSASREDQWPALPTPLDEPVWIERHNLLAEGLRKQSLVSSSSDTLEELKSRSRPSVRGNRRQSIRRASKQSVSSFVAPSQLVSQLVDTDTPDYGDALIEQRPSVRSKKGTEYMDLDDTDFGASDSRRASISFSMSKDDTAQSRLSMDSQMYVVPASQRRAPSEAPLADGSDGDSNSGDSNSEAGAPPASSVVEYEAQAQPAQDGDSTDLYAVALPATDSARNSNLLDSEGDQADMVVREAVEEEDVPFDSVDGYIPIDPLTRKASKTSAASMDL